MADFTILRSRRHRNRDGFVFEGVAAFPTTSLTGTLPIPSTQHVRNLQLTPLATSAAGTGSMYVRVGQATAISASAAFTFTVPWAGVITAASFVVASTVATDAANIWTVGVVNKTQTLTAVDIADVTNSNTVTTGTAFTAYTKRALTLSGTASNLVTIAGDVFELTFTKASSAANLTELSFQLTVGSVAGQSDEILSGPAPNASSGKIDLSSGKITISRTGSNPTSALKFAFRAETD